MPKKVNGSTIQMENSPSLISFASIGGKKESEGPLASYIDILCEDTTFGEQTWEKAESRMQKDAVNKCLEKSSLSTSDIDFLFAGDLLNQSIGSTYGLRDLNIPLIGLFGACSTMAEAIAMGSIFMDSNFCDYTLAVTSSHFCSAERQFRFPLEYGGQRPPTSQWTATGSGAVIIGKKAGPPYIKGLTIGKIQDLGIKDANNMGAAMAPAAADTIKMFLKDTNTNPSDYDLILTGDLGVIGSQLLVNLLERENIDISKNHNDCGKMIYDIESQDVHAGGSGCGCSAITLTSFILPKIRDGALKNVLFVATGALMSPTSVQQGESIPGIAHLINIVN